LRKLEGFEGGASPLPCLHNDAGSVSPTPLGLRPPPRTFGAQTPVRSLLASQAPDVVRRTRRPVVPRPGAGAVRGDKRRVPLRGRRSSSTGGAQPPRSTAPGFSRCDCSCTPIASVSYAPVQLAPSMIELLLCKQSLLTPAVLAPTCVRDVKTTNLRHLTAINMRNIPSVDRNKARPHRTASHQRSTRRDNPCQRDLPGKNLPPSRFPEKRIILPPSKPQVLISDLSHT